MAQKSGDVLRALDNFGKRSLHIQAQPFVYAADKDKRLEILNERTALERKDREDWLAARAAETEITKAERLKVQEQLKLIKAEKEKEKLEKKQAAKAQKAIEKEKAEIEKEEKRIKAIEQLMVKREQQKDKAIEQAKKKAEQRAIQELKREEQARERDAKIRRSIQERAEKEKARREIAEMTKQVYEERRKELALEAEVKRREQEELQAQAKLDAERKAAKARAEREAYEKGIREFRMATIKLEADRRLEEIAAKRVAREALEAQPITPPNVNMARTAEWAAAQSKPIPTNNPRLAAGHPNANPLQNVYVEDDDLFQEDNAVSRDPRLSHQVNNTLLKLVQEAKERLEVEKRQASKARNPVPITKTPTGSARPFHKGSVHPVQDDHGNAFLDSPLFASDDNQNNPPQAERKYDHDGQSDNSSTNEMNFRMQQHENTKRAFVQRRDVHSPPMQIKRHKPSESLGKISSVPSPVHPTYTRNASSSTGQELSAKLLSKILLGNDIVKQVEDGVFAMRLDESAHCSIVYLTTERGMLHHDLSHVGNVLSAFHEAALPEDDHVDASAWQAAKCFSAAVSLAKKAYEHGYNALIKVKAFSGVPSSKDSTVFEFFTSGIPAVVIVPDEVPKLVPVQAKTPNPTSSRREITEKQSAEANPGQQHRPPRTSYLDDVRQPLRTFYNSS